MLTVEAVLGNSLWVMLKPEKQIELQAALERIPRPMQGLATPECINNLKNEDWTCYRVHVSEDKMNWRWETFPHPSSWPKEHERNAAYLALEYDDNLRNYELNKVYMKRFDSKGCAYYREVSVWNLLVFSNLTLNFGGKVSEASKDQLFAGILNHRTPLEQLKRLTEGDPRLNAVFRKADGLLKELDSIAKRRKSED